MSRAQNREFQEWWNRQRQFLDNSPDDLNAAFLTVDVSTIPTSPSSSDPSTLDKGCLRSARQLSWLWILKFQQLLASLTWLPSASISLLRTANRRIASPDSPADSCSSRLYRVIKLFLFLVILLLCYELVAYFKGWHFSPPLAESAETMVERVYAKCLEIRTNYLATPLQTLTNVCIVFFLILSVDRVVSILGCFWIKVKKLKSVAAMEYGSLDTSAANVEDYPMVFVQIPMCNEKESSGIPPPPLHVEPMSIPSVPDWHSLSPAMEMYASELNCSAEQSPYSFFKPRWVKSTEQGLHSESAMSSMAPSPAASNSSNNTPHSRPMSAASYVTTANNSANTSCYSAPLNSPPKVMNLTSRDGLQNEQLSFPSLGTSLPWNATVADPGFAERAARSSVFGSRSFNSKTTQFGLNNPEFHNSSSPLVGNGKMPQVPSSLSLKAFGSQKGEKDSPLQDSSKSVNSQGESSVSKQVPYGEASGKPSNELNCRKREAVYKGKAKQPVSNPPANISKDAESRDDQNAKQINLNEAIGNEISPVKAEGEAKGNGNEKQPKDNSKPHEPTMDYIHVRARRGQATDRHSLAERVRREKISERMKFLQDLVPGCNKVTGKALMLDEIINYIQSLQRQVEFLSVKLASVNNCLDFHTDTVVSTDIYQSGSALPQPIFPLDSSASAIFGHQTQHNPGLLNSISNRTVTQSSADHLDIGLCQNFSVPLPPLDGFDQGVPQ
uniref:Uncharacterized protein MANES_13G052300 n=1 Tax=Rhizophora mucronata TaxID=61149 RepID=A0A2P2JF21_RHIMU